MNYLLVDGMNLFMRAKNASQRGDVNMRVGMCMHIMFTSIRKAWRDFNGDHVILCLEGRSWRKDVYPQYKENRKVKMAQRTRREVEDDEVFFDAFNDLVSYFTERTNCTVAQCSVAEADDLIAIWIQTHPDDQHIIISSDSDFYQLLAPNVRQYNGITKQLISLEGFVNADTGKTVVDTKTKLPLAPPDPEWLLFEKCVRGDTGDNVFSAYPGARLKGNKNKTGILEAFNDRVRSGYNFNNFMLQRWVDHNEKEHRVRDDYERNRMLIDLTAQPDDVRAKCIAALETAKQRPLVTQVGIHFMKFCGKWGLPKLSESAVDFGEILNASVTNG